MKNNGKRELAAGIAFSAAFVLWTVMIRCIDVRNTGPGKADVGFAAFNTWFHRLTGVHMTLYTVTDWLGLVPIAVCLCFVVLGLAQLIKRKSLFRVDRDILLLGVHYALVILAYLLFEMIPINYRPILIDGRLEASFPSSTTLLVLGVMPTLQFQINRRIQNPGVRMAAAVFVTAFSAFMVIGRLVSGVHWATDIIGSVFLSTGLCLLYRFFVGCMEKTARKDPEATNGIS